MKSAALACFLLVTLIAVGPVSADPPGREFSGTAVVDGPEGTRRMPVTLVANRYTPTEEVRQLAGLLEQGGQETLLGALRGRSDGALTIPIALAATEETSDGRRYLFLSPRRIRISETQFGEESLDYPFGIAVFTIDDFSGLGEGTLHVAAALSIDATGHLEVDDYDGADGRFEDLRQVR
jgi:hypothetical protein